MTPKPQVVIAGGGVAGLEAALALASLAEDRAAITLISPERDFLYKPLTVEEPFTNQPAARLELAPLLADLGIEYVEGAVTSVDTEGRTLVLASGHDPIPYDHLLVCIGGRARPAFSGVETFWSARSDLPIDRMIRTAAETPERRIAFIVPTGTAWSLPLYELALLTRRRSDELGIFGLALRIYTPEDRPLGIFGTAGSEAVGSVLTGRKIELETGTSVEESNGRLVVHPGGAPLDASAVIALPRIEGPQVSGLPADEHGFIPVDEYARVPDLHNVYAAGDGTIFPIKQGGLATQQADVAAEQIASALGAAVEPTPFRPVLRGQLITGDESLNLKHDVTGGQGEGAASLDYLWWPPQKIGGRYLSAMLGHEAVRETLDPPQRTIEVEVSLPHEWHGDLLSWDAEVASP